MKKRKIIGEVPIRGKNSIQSLWLRKRGKGKGLIKGSKKSQSKRELYGKGNKRVSHFLQSRTRKNMPTKESTKTL